MQLLHDVTTMRVAITKYVDLSSIWKSWLKEEDDYMASYYYQLKEVTEQEAKLEEFVTIHNSPNATIWDLET